MIYRYIGLETLISPMDYSKFQHIHMYLDNPLILILEH